MGIHVIKSHTTLSCVSTFRISGSVYHQTNDYMPCLHTLRFKADRIYLGNTTSQTLS